MDYDINRNWIGKVFKGGIRKLSSEKQSKEWSDETDKHWWRDPNLSIYSFNLAMMKYPLKLTEEKKDFLKLNYHSKENPLITLDVMYELFIHGLFIKLYNELRWFYSIREWHWKDLIDPKEEDELKYAIKACIVERGVQVFNQITNLHIERKRKTTSTLIIEEIPEWVHRVKDSTYPFTPYHVIDLAADLPNPIFAKRNILVEQAFMAFIQTPRE